MGGGAARIDALSHTGAGRCLSPTKTPQGSPDHTSQNGHEAPTRRRSHTPHCRSGVYGKLGPSSFPLAGCGAAYITSQALLNKEAGWPRILAAIISGCPAAQPCNQPNIAVEPTPKSFRSCAAPAIGRGSPRALGHPIRIILSTRWPTKGGESRYVHADHSRVANM